MEGFLLRRPDWCREAFAGLSYAVIDEFHSLTGRERGRQTLSLLRRLEAILHSSVPGLALSATFGDPREMARLLRPHRGDYPCAIVTDEDEREVRVDVRACLDIPGYLRGRVSEEGFEKMAEELYVLLREGHNLLFTNSRRRAEQLVQALASRCARDGHENVFFPHHGSLSVSLRQDLEHRLMAEGPVTAVCTNTLELGVDIGVMDSVVQVDPPSSPSSLRQRMGRAGRRGGQQHISASFCAKPR